MGPSIVRAALALSLLTPPGEGIAPTPAPPPSATRLSEPTGALHPAPEAPPEALQAVSVQPPASTWIAAGVAVGLFAAGLGFTLTATSIEHQVGTVNANGVYTGVTRERAVQGLNDVRIGNTLLVGAGLALVAAITFAVVHANSASPLPEAPPPAAPAAPLALQWSSP